MGTRRRRSLLGHRRPGDVRQHERAAGDRRGECLGRGVRRRQAPRARHRLVVAHAATTCSTRSTRTSWCATRASTCTRCGACSPTLCCRSTSRRTRDNSAAELATLGAGAGRSLRSFRARGAGRRRSRGNAARASATLRELADAINAALWRCRRALVPVDYTTGDRFEQDPALAAIRLPSLQTAPPRWPLSAGFGRGEVPEGPRDARPQPGRRRACAGERGACKPL